MGRSNRRKNQTRSPAAATAPRWSARSLIKAAAGVLVLGGICFTVWWGKTTDDRARGLQLCNEQQFALAEALLLAAWERNQRDAEVARALALGYVTAGRPEKAEPFLDHWADLQPRELRAQQLRLEVCLELDKRTGALDAAEKVLELDPGNPEAQRHLVLLAAGEGQYARVEQACRRFLQTNPTHPGLRYRLADACYHQGKLAEAEPLLDELLRMQPDNPAPLVLRAILYREAGQEREAVLLLQRAVARDPHSSRAYYHLAQALSHTGQQAEGERALAEFLRQSAAER
jgi:predicted Zn-dependent protease